MALKDCRGVPVSSDNQQSLERFERAMSLFQGYFVDPLAAADEILADDPTFVLAHLMRAGLMLTSSEKAAVPEIRRSFEAAAALADRANERERGHLVAIEAWLDGDFHGAAERYGQVLLDHPRDALALQVAHLCDFLLGQSWMLRDRIARVRPFWDKSTPGYGFVLGMHAFGLEEMGDYAAAEAAGRDALALNPADAWAVHAVAHVMEMQGRLEEGIAFLTDSEPHWAPENFFAYHNFWHRALYHLDRGEHEAALKLYDERIHPGHTEVAMELVDATALLWRMHLRGKPVGDRWGVIADAYEPVAEDGYYAFNDLHAMMAFTATGREPAAGRVLATMARAADGGGSNAMMARDVGLPTCRAILAFGRGEYGTVVEELLPVRPYANRFGGSHAQRDILSLTLVEAALRDGQANLARALAAERTQLKPASPFNWRLTARAAELAGDREGAARALERAA